LGRWRGIFSHKNGLGLWAIHGSIFLYTHAWMQGRWKIYFYVAWVCSIFCLIFSGSATAIIAGVLIWGFWLVLRATRYVSSNLLVIACSLAVATLLLSTYFFLDDIFALLGRDSTFTGRTGIWESALKFIADKPVLGHGYLTLGGQEFWNSLKFIAGDVRTPENGFLAILLDLGFLGLILFFVPFLICLWNGLHWLNYVEPADRYAIEFMILVLVTALVTALSDSNIFLAGGFDGVECFAAFFALMTLPKAPAAVVRDRIKIARKVGWLAEKKQGPDDHWWGAEWR